jgi:hypothetical protein
MKCNHRHKPTIDLWQTKAGKGYRYRKITTQDGLKPAAKRQAVDGCNDRLRPADTFGETGKAGRRTLERATLGLKFEVISSAKSFPTGAGHDCDP